MGYFGAKPCPFCCTREVPAGRRTCGRAACQTLATIGHNGAHFQLLPQGALRSLETDGVVVVGPDLIARRREVTTEDLRATIANYPESESAQRARAELARRGLR